MSIRYSLAMPPRRANTAPAAIEIWPAETPEEYTPGTRRLRDLSRDIQRPLESRLYHMRRVNNWTDARISHELDLHPFDLDALAATAGEI